jgi:hypothetical protein
MGSGYDSLMKEEDDGMEFAIAGLVLLVGILLVGIVADVAGCISLAELDHLR